MNSNNIKETIEKHYLRITEKRLQLFGLIRSEKEYSEAIARNELFRSISDLTLKLMVLEFVAASKLSISICAARIGIPETILNQKLNDPFVEFTFLEVERIVRFLKKLPVSFDRLKIKHLLR